MAITHRRSSSLDPVTRRIVWELLNGMGTNHIHLEHELFRLAHVYREGLTEKEFQFLEKRCEVLKDENEKLVKLKDRLKGSLNGRA